MELRAARLFSKVEFKSLHCSFKVFLLLSFVCYLVWYLSQSHNGHNNWGNAVYAFARDLVMSTEVEICCPTIKTKTKQLLRVCVYLCGEKGSLLTSIRRKIWLIVRAEVRNGMVLLLWGCVSSFLLPVPTLNLKGYLGRKYLSPIQYIYWGTWLFVPVP